MPRATVIAYYPRNFHGFLHAGYAVPAYNVLLDFERERRTRKSFLKYRGARQNSYLGNVCFHEMNGFANVRATLILIL